MARICILFQVIDGYMNVLMQQHPGRLFAFPSQFAQKLMHEDDHPWTYAKVHWSVEYQTKDVY